MKILIAGFGSIGRRHFRNLQELGVEDILLYRTHQSTLPVEELKDYIVETDLQKALQHKPDAVIIANPTAKHLDVAMAAAEAGCHIFFEKPISHDLQRIEEFTKLVEEKRVQVFVGFQFRFHPGLRVVKKWLEEGAIGRPLAVRSHWGEYLPGWHPWEDYRKSYTSRTDLGGGVVLTLSHPLDYLRWLLGEVDKLWAFGGHLTDLEVEVDDMAEIGLKFCSGVIGSMQLNYIQRPAKHDLEIIGSQGSITWDNNDGAARRFDVEKNEWEIVPVPEGFERNTLFLDEMDHFLQVVKGEIKPLCDLNDGKKALKLALNVLKSAEGGELISF